MPTKTPVGDGTALLTPKFNTQTEKQFICHHPAYWEGCNRFLETSGLIRGFVEGNAYRKSASHSSFSEILFCPLCFDFIAFIVKQFFLRKIIGSRYGPREVLRGTWVGHGPTRFLVAPLLAPHSFLLDFTYKFL